MGCFKKKNQDDEEKTRKPSSKEGFYLHCQLDFFTTFLSNLVPYFYSQLSNTPLNFPIGFLTVVIFSESTNQCSEMIEKLSKSFES